MDDFYKKYHLSVQKFVQNRVDDEGVVEELTQDILLAAWKNRESFKGESQEFSWVCSIAKHKIIDYYRKKKLKTILFSANPVFEEIADKALTPERDVLKNELKNEILKTFDEINEGYRHLLRLKYIEGLSVAKIAKNLNSTIKAVESKLIRAKKSFRQQWSYDFEETKKNK